MNFKAYNRSQNLLLPPSFGDFLGESHEAVVLAEMLEGLNLSSLEGGYTNASGGRSAYHPAMLLSVLLYSYMNGIFSSRKIAGLLKRDLAFMYLSGNQTPDFRTLCRFRKEQGANLEEVFVQVVDKARALGFVTFGDVSLDGTKVKASANKDKNETQDSLEKKIRHLMEEAQRIDALEDEEFGNQEDSVDPQLKTREGRARRREEIEKKRAQASSHLEQRLRAHERVPKDAKLNTTDPDSKLMKMKHGGFQNGYNLQVMSEQGFVLSHYTSAMSADQPLLIPSLQQFQELHATLPAGLLADKGYSSEDNFAFCEHVGVDAYIPVHKEPIDLAPYTYNQTTDTYMHEDGRMFSLKQRMKKKEKQEGEPKYRRFVYEHTDEMTKKKSYQRIYRGQSRVEPHNTRPQSQETHLGQDLHRSLFCFGYTKLLLAQEFWDRLLRAFFTFTTSFDRTWSFC